MMALAFDAADEDQVNLFTAIVRHRALIPPISGSCQPPQDRAAFAWYGITGPTYMCSTRVRVKARDFVKPRPPYTNSSMSRSSIAADTREISVCCSASRCAPPMSSRGRAENDSVIRDGPMAHSR